MPLRVHGIYSWSLLKIMTILTLPLPAKNSTSQPSHRAWLKDLLNPPEDSGSANPIVAANDTLSPSPQSSGIPQNIAKSTNSFPSLLSGFLSFVPPAPPAYTPPAPAPAVSAPVEVAPSSISERHGANSYYSYYIPPNYYYHYNSYYQYSWYVPTARDIHYVQPLRTSDAHEAIEIEMEHDQTIPPTPTSNTSSMAAIEIEEPFILDTPTSDSTDPESSLAATPATTTNTNPLKSCSICHATYSSGNWYKHKDHNTGGYMCKSCYVCLNRRLKTMKKAGPVDMHAAISSVLESKSKRSISLTSAAHRRAVLGIKRNEGKICVLCGANRSSGDWYRDHGNLEQNGRVNCQRCYQRMKKLRRVHAI